MSGSLFAGGLIAKMTDHSEPSRYPPRVAQSYARSSTVLNRASLFRTIVRRIVGKLRYLIALARGCIRELRSCLRRIALLFAERHRLTHLPVGAACHLGPTGVPQECIRTRDCIADIKNFAERYPWATLFDWEHFREGWEAGEKWGRNTQCFCSSANEES